MIKALVRDWMSPNPITIDLKTTLPEAHKLMKECHVRRLPVVDHGDLVGIVTLGDIRESSASDVKSLSIFEFHYLLAKLTVDKIMTPDPITISPNSTIREAAGAMLENKISGLPVVENGRLVGIITESDIFRVLVKEDEPVRAGAGGR